MKTKKLLFALLAVALMIGACNTVTDLADVTFDAELKADLNCEVPPGSFKSGINGAFSVSETIDPLSDPEVEKYVDNIKSWEVTSVTGEILSVSKEGVNLLSANVEVFSNNHNASWQISNTPLVVGETITLDNGNGQWNTIDNILGDKDVFTISASGETDQDDVTFVIQVIVQTKITANPL